MRPLLLLTLSTLLAPMAAAQSSPDSTRLAPHTLTVQLPVTLRYLLYVPPAYAARADTPWPLVLFLHGSGERGDDLARVAIHGPAKHIAQGQDFPFLLVAPQLPEDRPGWNPLELGALLDDLQARYRIDPDRVYVTGLSMGGYGTWELGITFPDRFAALVPICGGSRTWRAPLLRSTPIWAFHGGQDPVVPVRESQEMVDAVNRSGGSARLTLYPDAGHDSWTEAYASPALYTWLLAQRRTR